MELGTLLPDFLEKEKKNLMRRHSRFDLDDDEYISIFDDDDDKVKTLNDNKPALIELFKTTNGRCLVSAVVAIVLTFPLFLYVLDSQREAVQQENNRVLTATQIDTSEQFKWAIDTKTGNVILNDYVHAPQGKTASVDGVTLKGNSALYISWQKEEYTMHTRTVTYSCGKNQTCTRVETYWTWDSAGSNENRLDSVMFKGQLLPESWFEDQVQQVDTEKELSISKDSRFAGKTNDGSYIYDDSDTRYYFNAVGGGYKGTIVLSTAGDKVSKVSNFSKNETIEEYKEYYSSNARAYTIPVIMEILLVGIILFISWFCSDLSEEFRESLERGY